MSKSKLLKEAIADAKAVRETAIANAKIALEEAFTPRLQSILSKKLQAEMEGEEEELEEELDSSEIGGGDNKEPDADAKSAHTELDPETDSETAEPDEEDENVDVVAEEEAHDGEEEISEGEYGDEETHEEGYGEEEIEEEEDEDELDLEAIIRELEGEDDEEHHEGTYEGEHEEELEEESPAHDAVGYEDPTNADDAEINEEEGEEEVHEEEEEEDVIDLDEILREMGYVSEEEHGEEEVEEGEDKDEKYESLQSDLEEAYKTIKTLRGTINEVNLLNAKLLYTNKLFRGYNLTNEQKVKVVENLDRTTSVREVKLVYATLAESMKFGGTQKKVKKNITEGFASKPAASTAPKQEVITESADVLANRFKQLAGIK